MDFGGAPTAPAASLIEISRVLEETARLVREHAGAGAPGSIPEVEREEPETDPGWVRSLLDLRALRREFLGFEASDAALAMMLALYAAGLEGRRLHQTALAVAARVPETTAFRTVYRFLDAGIFTRESDTEDKRLLLLALSDTAAMRLRAYLAAATHIAPLLA